VGGCLIDIPKVCCPTPRKVMNVEDSEPAVHVDSPKKSKIYKLTQLKVCEVIPNGETIPPILPAKPLSLTRRIRYIPLGYSTNCETLEHQFNTQKLLKNRREVAAVYFQLQMYSQ